MNINRCGPWILQLVLVIGAIVAGLIGKSEVFISCVIGAIIVGTSTKTDED